MNLQQILSSDLAARLGWTLLHSLWQGAAVALVLVVTMRLLRFHSPPLRYSAALGSLAVLLIAMGMTFAGSGPVRQDQSVASATIARVEASAPSGPPSDPTVAAVSLPTSSVLPRSLPTSASRLSLFTTRLQRIVPYLACAWSLGVLLVSLWHTGGWIAVQRLRRLGVESVDAAKGKDEHTKRTKSADNLKNIGGLVGMYANDFHGVYPPNLATAFKVELDNRGDAKFLKSPMGDDKTGHEYTYLYYPGMTRPIPDDRVIAYDAPDAARNGGACVLFGDGNVRWLDAAKLNAALGKTEAERPRN